jgi:hypothetical protein
LTPADLHRQQRICAAIGVVVDRRAGEDEQQRGMRLFE